VEFFLKIVEIDTHIVHNTELIFRVPRPQKSFLNPKKGQIQAMLKYRGLLCQFQWQISMNGYLLHHSGIHHILGSYQGL
jgi:hypothetical protein